MLKRNLSNFLLAAVVSLPMTSFADTQVTLPSPGYDTITGVYLSGFVGIGTFSAYDIANVTVAQESTPNFTGGAAIGYRDNNGFSYDASYKYSKFRVNSFFRGTVSKTSSTSFSGTSKLYSHSLFADVYYSFARAFDLNYFIMPYVGVGVGVSWNYLETGGVLVNTSGGKGITIPSSSSAIASSYYTHSGHGYITRTVDFAWRAMLGFHYYLSDYVFVDLRYSYESLGSLQFGINSTDSADEIEVRSNVFTVSMNYIFK